MASSNPTDIELMVSNWARKYQIDSKQNVPQSVQILMVQFSNSIIGCKFLTLKEDMEFVQLLLTKLPSIRRFTHLFTASHHQYSAAKFHEYCDDKGATITIIKSNFKNTFGGFTSKSWKTSSTYDLCKDEHAFLFLINSADKNIQTKCPLLFEINEDEFSINSAIIFDDNVGPFFGAGPDLIIRDNCNIRLHHMDSGEDNTSHVCHRSYNYPHDDFVLCGGPTEDIPCYLFSVIDYQVFHVSL